MQKSMKTPAALLWLVCFWSVGSALGIWIASGNVDILAAALRLADGSDRSALPLSALLPLFAVYLASRLRLPGLIFPILFLKSLLDSFLLMGISAAYASATWLVAALLLFTDKVATVFLLYFAGKCLTEQDQPQTMRFISILLIIAVTILVDRFYIAPYFALFAL